jgi:predicted ATP-grasp superfamily ATP-dependent carboligase
VGFGAAILDFVREHPTRVLLPAGDASIAAVTPLRADLAALGCTLALAPDAALAIANDKARTLGLAAQLGIKAPRSISLETVEDLAVAISELGFPFVLKPTTSWTGNSDQRAVPVAVSDKAEATAAVEGFFAEGAHVLAQEFIGGRRERVTLFIAQGEVKASCGHVAVRNYPPFGGVSAVRESIRVPDDILDAATRLALAIGIEGPCEAEFRRDARNCPRLMEINARVAGTLGHTVLAGVDLPRLTWQWATGRAVEPAASARVGVRTRSLAGDLMWLSQNRHWQGRPDSEPIGRSLWLFLSEFCRARHYDHFSWLDPWPAVVEARRLLTVATGRVRRR